MLRSLGVVAAAGALTIALATPGAANEISSNQERPDDGLGVAAVHAALERDLGISASQAAQLMERQAEVVALSAQLEGELGSAFAGSWFDHQTGTLTVATADPATAGLATAAGAEAQVVTNSLEDLTAIEAELTAMVQADPAGTAEVTAWRIDAATNQVVVTVKEGFAASVDELVEEHGAAISVVESAVDPSFTNHGGEPFLDGGIEYAVAGGGICSTGINAASGGTSFNYTAAHCGNVGQQTSHSGTAIGPFVSRHQGSDTALIRVDNPAWTVGPWIWTYPGFVTVVNAVNAVPGTAMCTSGRTTGVTCGTVTATGETVNFGGLVVSNLTRHNACVEPGDSGGSNYGPPNSASVSALGTTVGAQLFFGQFCGQRLGQPNVSWYAPIVPAVGIHGIPVITN